MARVLIKRANTPGKNTITEPGDLIHVLRDDQDFGKRELAQTDRYLCVELQGISYDTLAPFVDDDPGEADGSFLPMLRTHRVDPEAVIAAFGREADGRILIRGAGRQTLINSIEQKPRKPNPEFV